MTPQKYEKLTFGAVYALIERMAAKRKWTVNELGRRGGVSRTTIWRQKKAKQKPNYATFLKLKEAAR